MASWISRTATSPRLQRYCMISSSRRVNLIFGEGDIAPPTERGNPTTFVEGVNFRLLGCWVAGLGCWVAESKTQNACHPERSRGTWSGWAARVSRHPAAQLPRLTLGMTVLYRRARFDSQATQQSRNSGDYRTRIGTLTRRSSIEPFLPMVTASS